MTTCPRCCSIWHKTLHQQCGSTRASPKSKRMRKDPLSKRNICVTLNVYFHECSTISTSEQRLDTNHWQRVYPADPRKGASTTFQWTNASIRKDASFVVGTPRSLGCVPEASATNWDWCWAGVCVDGRVALQLLWQSLIAATRTLHPIFACLRCRCYMMRRLVASHALKIPERPKYYASLHNERREKLQVIIVDILSKVNQWGNSV